MRCQFRFRHCLLIACVGFMACAHDPSKAENISNNVELSEQGSGNTQLSVSEDKKVVHKKVMITEELIVLQNEVRTLEERVYGNRTFGSRGLYGVLKDCRELLVEKANGESGRLIWTETVDRVTINEKDISPGMSDEMLRDRLGRFRGYKQVLLKRQDEFYEKVGICKTELMSRKDTAQK
jgi:hypothetical protein